MRKVDYETEKSIVRGVIHYWRSETRSGMYFYTVKRGVGVRYAAYDTYTRLCDETVLVDLDLDSEVVGLPPNSNGYRAAFELDIDETWN